MRIVVVWLLLIVALWGNEITSQYSSWRYVLKEFDIPQSFVDNERFIEFAKRRGSFLRGFYFKSLVRGGELVQRVKQKLVNAGLSDLLVYMSIVESGMNSNAVSKKKAVGLWQFMPYTARLYDLEVSSYDDQRNNPAHATRAAIKYLNKLYGDFGKWYLAVMAYNCGEGRLKRAIEKAHSDNLELLTNSYLGYLPKETQEYIMKILLVAMIGEEDVVHTIDQFESLKQKNVEVEIEGGSSLKKLSRALQYPYKKLKSLNSWVKGEYLPLEKQHYKVLIPESKIFRFYLTYQTHKEFHENEEVNLVTHIVQEGETLETIALKYHTNIGRIREINMFDHPIKKGDLLVIPVSQKQLQKHAPWSNTK